MSVQAAYVTRRSSLVECGIFLGVFSGRLKKYPVMSYVFASHSLMRWR